MRSLMLRLHQRGFPDTLRFSGYAWIRLYQNYVGYVAFTLQKSKKKKDRCSYSFYMHAINIQKSAHESRERYERTDSDTFITTLEESHNSLENLHTTVPTASQEASCCLFSLQAQTYWHFNLKSNTWLFVVQFGYVTTEQRVNTVLGEREPFERSQLQLHSIFCMCSFSQAWRKERFLYSI